MEVRIRRFPVLAFRLLRDYEIGSFMPSRIRRALHPKSHHARQIAPVTESAPRPLPGNQWRGWSPITAPVAKRRYRRFPPRANTPPRSPRSFTGSFLDSLSVENLFGNDPLVLRSPRLCSFAPEVGSRYFNGSAHLIEPRTHSGANPLLQRILA